MKNKFKKGDYIESTLVPERDRYDWFGRVVKISGSGYNPLVYTIQRDDPIDGCWTTMEAYMRLRFRQQEIFE